MNSSVRIIGDPGSTHNGSLEKCKELVSIGKDCGLDAVKFQLLTQNELGNGNIGFDWETFPEILEHAYKVGTQVFASVFDQSGADWLKRNGVKKIKFSYSQRGKLELYDRLHFFDEVFLSCGVMDGVVKLGSNTIKNLTRLYCIPEYPVPYEINFENIFDRFDGFSDHSMGISQTLKARDAGCAIFEKHFKGDWETYCDDAKFALNPKELEKLCKELGTSGRKTPSPKAA